MYIINMEMDIPLQSVNFAYIQYRYKTKVLVCNMIALSCLKVQYSLHKIYTLLFFPSTLYKNSLVSLFSQVLFPFHNLDRYHIIVHYDYNLHYMFNTSFVCLNV